MANYYLKLSDKAREDMFTNAHPLIKKAQAIIEEYYTHHIGKNFYDWKFCFEAQYIDHQLIDSFQKMKEKILNPLYSVYDEHDVQISKETFFDIVDEHQNNPHSASKEYSDHGCFADEEGYDFTYSKFN